MHTSPIDAMQLWINPATLHPWDHIYIQKAVQLGPRSTALPDMAECTSIHICNHV